MSYKLIKYEQRPVNLPPKRLTLKQKIKVPEPAIDNLSEGRTQSQVSSSFGQQDGIKKLLMDYNSLDTLSSPNLKRNLNSPLCTSD